jgi:hypothetical protein
VVHYVNYENERWRVETTGGSRDVGGMKSAGALFVHEETGRRVPGQLNPVDVERPTDARLIEALTAALGDLRSTVPTVLSHKVGDQTGFEIVHSMYTLVGQESTLVEKFGYSFSTSQVILDEPTTRRDLSKFFGLSAVQIDELLRDAPRVG